MIGFRELDDTDPALAHSPLVRGIEKILAWIGEHGGIRLEKPNAADQNVSPRTFICTMP